MKQEITRFIEALSARLLFADQRTVRALTKMVEDPDKVADSIVRDLGSDTQVLHLGPSKCGVCDQPVNINKHDTSGND